jgi:peptide-methionine (R)-S-oxide reductase
MITWNEIIKFASEGNPVPERRVEKSDQEWKELLTIEQYKITRL